jgi:hypothetical protein
VCSLIAPPRPSRARPRSECGSCPCPRWSVWGWDPKEAQHLGGGGLPDASSAGGASPPPSRKFPFAQGKAPEGPGAGAGPHRVAADPRGSPHKPRKERRGERGLSGVERYAAGGSPGGGRTWESDPPPQDPLRPPLRGLEGPGRGGGVEKDCPPIPPAFSGLSGRVLGEASRGFCRPGGRKWPICAAARARGSLPPPPPSRIQVVQDDAGLISLTKSPKGRGGGLHPPRPPPDNLDSHHGVDPSPPRPGRRKPPILGGGLLSQPRSTLPPHPLKPPGGRGGVHARLPG